MCKNVKLYYLPGVYQPNSAATNRSLSYIKGLSELGVDTKVIYFRPNKSFDCLDIEYSHIEIYSYWRKFYSNNRFLQYICLIIFYIHFLLSLKKGDVVYCYGCADIWSLIVRFRKGVKVYVEYTEHPEVTGIGGAFLTPSLNTFYRLLGMVNGLFVITTGLRDFYISKGVSPDKVFIANITVDVDRFKELKKTETREPYIACCGVISNNKDGIDILIKSFAKVVQEFGNIKLYLIGPTPNEEDNNKNIELISKLGIESHVVFKGVLPALQIPQVLKDAQVLLLCRPNNKQAKYGFATKIGEYLLTENPVVVTTVGDFPIFFKDKENVLFSEPDNPNLFAEKILWALKNSFQAEMIGKNGADFALKNFSYLNVVKKIIEIIGIIPSNACYANK